MIDVDDLDLTKDFSFVQRGGGARRTSILSYRYFRLFVSHFSFLRFFVLYRLPFEVIFSHNRPTLHRLRRVRRAGVCVLYR